MDSAERRELNELIIRQTKMEALDDEIMKKIKSIAKKNDTYVQTAFDKLFVQLKANHSGKRYMAILIMNEFMQKSKLFRSQMAEHFQDFVEFAIAGGKATKHSKNIINDEAVQVKTDLYRQRSNSSVLSVSVLPPPEEKRKILRSTALRFVEQWAEKFGEQYKKIDLGHKYVRDVLQMKMPEIAAKNKQRQIQEEEIERRKQQVLKVKYEQVKSNINEFMLDVTVTIKQMELCLDSIVPDFDTLLKSELQGDQEEEEAVEQQVAASSSSSTAAAETAPSTSTENADINYDEWEEANPNEASASATQEGEAEVDNTTFQDLHSLNEQYSLDEIVQAAGLGSASYELTIQISDCFKNIKNSENSELYEALQDGYHVLVTKYEPKVKEWIQVMTEMAVIEDPAEQKVYQDLMSRCININNRISVCRQKCEDLDIKATKKGMFATQEDVSSSVSKKLLDEIHSIIKKPATPVSKKQEKRKLEEKPKEQKKKKQKTTK